MGAACSSVEQGASRSDRRRSTFTTEVLSVKAAKDFQERYSSSSSYNPRLLYVTHKSSKCEYVCRIVRKAHAPCQDAQLIRQHFQRLNSLEHPHLCKFVEVFEDAETYYMIYEKANPITLFKHIQQGESFVEEDAAEYTRQMAMALAVAHEQNLFHGRLNPNKVIIQHEDRDDHEEDEEGREEGREEDEELPAQVKICDMGQGMILRSGCMQQLLQITAAGDPKLAPRKELVECMPPEVAWDEVSSAPVAEALPAQLQKLDVWSLGCVVYQMLTGLAPFCAATSEELVERVKSGGVEFGSDWSNLSQEARDVTEAMLKVNAGLRPTASGLLRHPWLRMPRTRLQKGHLIRLLRNIRLNASEGHFKRMVMRVIAQQLPPEHPQVARIENAFRFFDRNGDGVLGCSEICEQVRKAFSNTKEGDLERNLEDVVGLLDRDGSHTVNLQEFVAGSLNPKLMSKNAILWNAFSAFDQDGDGNVSVDEIVNIVRQIEAGLLGTEQVDGLVKLIREEIQQITARSTIDFDQFVYIMSTPTGRSDGQKALRRDLSRTAHTMCGVDCYNVRKARPLQWDWQRMSQSPASAYRRLNLVNVGKGDKVGVSSEFKDAARNVKPPRSGKQPAQGAKR